MAAAFLPDANGARNMIINGNALFLMGTTGTIYRYEVITAIKDTDAFQTEIFPNPVKDHLYIKIPSSISYSIYNCEGKTISEGIAENLIDCSKLVSGIYMIRFSNSERMLTKRFIKVQD
jgi:hypothetical protein